MRRLLQFASYTTFESNSSDVTEGYAADWSVGQLREPAQRIADRIDELMKGK